MLTEQIRRLVENATVRLPQLGGQGVLVEGGVILTAAHCLQWNGEGAMALGDSFVCDVVTRDGRTLQVEPYAVEPVHDIALLGADVNDRKSYMAFEAWCDQTRGVRVGRDEYELFAPVPVDVFSHKGEWIAGTVQQVCEDAPTLVLMTSPPIQGGTSGGPIVDGSGALVGVVSWGELEGNCPRPHMALPVWVCRKHLFMAE
jgi:S1-C subfamily serine protease